MKELQFDVVVHLVGEQAVPKYMAVNLSESPQHILLTTTKTKPQYRLLSEVCSSRGRTISHVEVPATDYAGIKEVLATIPELHERHVGVNLTGGTKPMFAAALDFCRERNCVPFYLDTQERVISFFAEGNLKLPMPKVFESVGEFARLGNYKIKGAVKRSSDLSEARRELVSLFWQNKDWVRRVIADFSKATDKRFQNQKWSPPDCYRDATHFILNPRRGNKREEALARAWESVFPSKGCDWRDAARFGAGEWFEEWLLLQFAGCRKSADFVDLCSAVSLAYADGESDRSAQEIDLAFTDGYVLTLIECKAGAVNQEHIQKLENLRRQIGGAMGRSLLCAINYQYPDDIVVERVKNGSISLVSGDKALRMLPNRLEKIRPRRCYQDERDYD